MSSETLSQATPPPQSQTQKKKEDMKKVIASDCQEDISFLFLDTVYTDLQPGTDAFFH